MIVYIFLVVHNRFHYGCCDRDKKGKLFISLQQTFLKTLNPPKTYFHAKIITVSAV